MTAPYTGRCACGAVTATLSGEPLGVRLCFCRQCQQIAAGGPTANAVFAVEGAELRGPLAAHTFTAHSGATLTQHFCPSCGTPVYGQSSARTHLMSLRLGFLDEGHSLAPDTAIWVSEKPGWVPIDPALPQFLQQAPPPVAKA